MLSTADETMSASSPWYSRGVLLSITRARAGAVVGHHKVHGVKFHAPRITSCRGDRSAFGEHTWAVCAGDCPHNTRSRTVSASNVPRMPTCPSVQQSDGRSDQE
jgi:hypothetical protein